MEEDAVMYSLGIEIYLYLSVGHNHTLFYFWSPEELKKTENFWYPQDPNIGFLEIHL